MGQFWKALGFGHGNPVNALAEFALHESDDLFGGKTQGIGDGL